MHHHVELEYSSYCSQFVNTDLKFYGCVADYGLDVIKKGEDVCAVGDNVDESRATHFVVSVKNNKLLSYRGDLMVRGSSELLWPEQVWDCDMTYNSYDLEHDTADGKITVRWCDVIDEGGAEIEENVESRFSGSPIVQLVCHAMQEYDAYLQFVEVGT